LVEAGATACARSDDRGLDDRRVVPVVLGIGVGSESRQPLAVAITGVDYLVDLPDAGRGASGVQLTEQPGRLRRGLDQSGDRPR
jgi:hypothetical protein